MKARLFLFAAVFSLLAGTIAVPAFAATTLCVNPNGKLGCFSTITDAVNAATAGTTIKIAPGHYHEMVTITIPVNLQGSGPRGRSVVIDATGLPHAIYVTGVTGPMTIARITAANAQREGILIENSSNVEVKYSTIRDNDLALTAGSGGPTCTGAFPFDQEDCGEGLHLRGVTYSVVDHDLIQDNAGGVLITDSTGPSHDNLITQNVVQNNVPDCGITMPSHPPCSTTAGAQPPNDVNGCVPSVGTPSYGVFNNTVSYNSSTGNGAAGTGVFAPTPGTASYGNLIINNTLMNNRQGGVVLHSHNEGQNLNYNVITGNMISANGGDPDSGGGASAPPVGIVVFSDGSVDLSATPPKTAAAPIVGTLISHNRIMNESIDVFVGNTATNVNVMYNDLLGANFIGVDNTGTGIVGAMYNYWGCTGGPSIRGCSGVAGPGTTITSPFVTSPLNTNK